MAIIKCKMCGGTLEITNNETVAVCEYCGTQQTLPKTTDEVTTNLYNRANTLRLKSEFDKAAQTYEKILEIDNTQAEAHWGIILCKYGIEYIEDPKTFQRVPTCHRTQLESVTTDADYLAAIGYADAAQRAVYEKEAAVIDALQKDILQIVHQEKPFDVFLCYKETDESGRRTQDSVIANDIYYQLTREGFKVFYAAITLESKLGQKYEPYIFAALNSAKVMLVLGTKPEYFSAVWVKNEWSRFMKLMRADRSRLLIPCYRDMDAYDLPEEFAHLQAQDMSKIGFINDVVRGIRKVILKEEVPKFAVATAQHATVSAPSANTVPLLKRAFMFLEDEDWSSADDYCEKVLDIDPECAEAYLGKLLVEKRLSKREALATCEIAFDSSKNYEKCIRFADNVLKAELESYLQQVEEKCLRHKRKIAALNLEKSTLLSERDKLDEEIYILHENLVVRELEKRISSLQDKKDSLGMFKGKERYSLQQQIETERKSLLDAKAKQRRAVADIRDKIREIDVRIEEIKKMLEQSNVKEEEYEDVFSVVCPFCNEELFFDETVLADGEIVCLNCGQRLEFRYQ